MRRIKIDLSATGRARVIVASAAVTLGCIAVSVVLADAGVIPYDTGHLGKFVFATIVVPIVLAFPVMYFLMSKLRELGLAHERLTVYASTDGLTQVMNRAAFSTLVEAYLKEVRDQRGESRGALLIIDADNFKSVNDNFGHDLGDHALVTIAASIKAMLRNPDLIGRLGGEEFGVFLPGASPDQASIVAERIRQNVNDAAFEPAGTRHRLSVSVGGAVFEHQLSFTELFREADRQLYRAKQNGRNRVFVVPMNSTALAA
jgi:diguanylate cyclase